MIDLIAFSAYSVPVDYLDPDEYDALATQFPSEPSSRVAEVRQEALDRFKRFCETEYGPVSSYGPEKGRMAFEESEVEQLAWYAGGNVFTYDEMGEVASDMWQKYDDATWEGASAADADRLLPT